MTTVAKKPVALKTSSLYESAVLPKKIEALHKSGQKVQAECHKIACSTLLHIGKHKDVRMAMMVMQAMPEMSRKNGLRKWFEHFGPVKFSLDGDGNEIAVYDKSKHVQLGEAMVKPFWKFSATEGKAYEPIDVNEEVQKLIAKIRNDTVKTGRDHSEALAMLTVRPSVYDRAITKPVVPTADPLAA